MQEREGYFLIEKMIRKFGLKVEFIEALKLTNEKYAKDLLLKMREGFWWGFVAVCKKLKISIAEVPIEHFSRIKGTPGYGIKELPGIIIRNIILLINYGTVLYKKI